MTKGICMCLDNCDIYNTMDTKLRLVGHSKFILASVLVWLITLPNYRLAQEHVFINKGYHGSYKMLVVICLFNTAMFTSKFILMLFYVVAQYNTLHHCDHISRKQPSCNYYVPSVHYTI